MLTHLKNAVTRLMAQCMRTTIYGLVLFAVSSSAWLSALDSVSVRATSPIVREGSSGSSIFTITRTGATGPLTVSYVMGGTATSGFDYTALPGSVSFADGQASATVVVTPTNDGFIEGRETVLLTLSSSATYIIGVSSSAQITIADDDMTATLNPVDVQADEDVSLIGDSRIGVLQVLFNSAVLQKTASMRFSGSAAMGTDYTIKYRVSANAASTYLSGAGEGYRVNAAALAGDTSIAVKGTTGFFPGDIFKIDGDATFYMVTSFVVLPASTGTLNFVNVDPAATGSGLSVAIPAPSITAPGPVIRTRITSPTATTLFLSIPSVCTKVEYAVEPVSDGVAEGAEDVVMTLLASDDYQISDPTVATVQIADSDCIVDVNLGGNAGKPNSSGSFLVTLSQAFDHALYVPYTIDSSSTAIAGTDYVALPGFIYIPAFATTGQIIVTPLNTPVPVGLRSLTISLDSTNDYRLAGSGSSGTNPSATVNITDSLGVVGILATGTNAVESSSPTPGAFTVSIARNSVGAVSVNYTVSGAAVSGVRYNTLTGQVTIASGSNTAQIVVNPVDTPFAEGTQSVIVTLASGQGYSLNSAALSGQISIDDDEPTISIARVADATRPSTVGSFLVSYPGVPAGSALNRSLVVNYTFSGTAISGTDFTGASSVTIPTGSLSAPITISPIDNSVTANQTVTVTLTVPATNPTYTIGTGTASLTILPVATIPANKPVPGANPSDLDATDCGNGSGIGLLLCFGLLGLGGTRIRRRRAA